MIAKIKALVSTPVKPTWIKIAEGELGQREIRGGENKRIIEYHKSTKLAATEDEISWCSSFVNWCMLKAGYDRTYSAAARSWLGEGQVLKGFRKYSIVIFKRGNSAWQGHVGFAIEETKTHVRVLGGNQSDKVCYAWYPKAKVLGYRWPVRAAVEQKLA